jgi:hypothetical protein
MTTDDGYTVNKHVNRDGWFRVRRWYGVRERLPIAASPILFVMNGRVL